MVKQISATTCNCEGYVLEFAWRPWDEHCESIDVVLSLTFAERIGGARIESQAFYFSIADIKDFAEFLIHSSGRTMLTEILEKHTFVPLNLGFEMSLFDCDEEGANLQTLLNIGSVNEHRVYAGGYSYIPLSAIQQFSDSLLELINRLQKTSNGSGVFD